MKQKKGSVNSKTKQWNLPKHSRKNERERESERIKITENSLSNLWENIKRADSCIIGSQKEKRKQKGAEILFEEIMVENFPSLVKDINLQIQEVSKPHPGKKSKDIHVQTHHIQIERKKS